MAHNAMSMSDNRTTVPDEDILSAIRDHYAPVIGTKDLADKVGITRQAVDKRLRRFEDDGLVETDKIGRSRIWWLTTDGRRKLQSP